MKPWTPALISLAVLLASPLAQAQNPGAVPIPPIPGAADSGSLPPIPLPPQMQAVPTAKKEEVKAVTPPAIPVPGGADKIGGAPVTASTATPAATGASPVSTTPVATATTTPPAPSNGLVIPALPAPPPEIAAATTPTTTPPPLPPIAGGDKGTDEAKDEGEKPLPDSSLAAKLNASPMGIVLPPAPKLPKVHEHAAGRGHSWDSTLKPVMTPHNIAFNYRRQLMPSTIYRPEYDADNRHLPTSVSREDYDRALLESVAANDIDATRALLDAGSSPNVINAEGDPALIVALNHGATDTARLLVARGATPTMIGPSGRSPYDVASQTGQLWLMTPPTAMR